MSDEERYGERDLTYSNWHRVRSIGRFVGRDMAELLTMIDIDDFEYCKFCGDPLAAIETARDVGQSNKTYRVVQKVARGLDILGLLVYYKPSERMIPGRTEHGVTRLMPDIDWFRIQVVNQPTVSLERGVRRVAPSKQHRITPLKYAQWLEHLHTEHHDCRLRRASAA